MSNFEVLAKKFNFENIECEDQQQQQHPHKHPHNQQQTSSSPSLSPLRTRLWTAPIETSNKRIQQKQPCKAVFRSAQRRSATGIRRADKHLEEPALLVDLEGICLDEKCLNNLIDKDENLENSKEERKTPENTSSNLSSSLTTARRLSNTSENTKGEKKNSAMSKDSGIDF
ncbi:unnamed protein product [Meloidogyne enterolobii]|uniref:Uncharacterized protein n=1 Tax=Meloidogyne enterolobii TaxID=390850 RepID=A0ACB0ZT74_MELEN